MNDGVEATPSEYGVPPHPDLGDQDAPPLDLAGLTAPVPKPKEPAAMRAARGKLKTEAPDALKEALKVQLQSIMDKPIGAMMLLELEQTASIAQKLLIVAGDPRVMPLGGRRGLGLGGYGPGMDTLVAPQDFDDGGALGVGGEGLMPLMPGMPAENFGAASIREMMETAKAPRIDDLFESLRMAKKDGTMPEAVAKLQEKINVALDLEPAEKPPEDSLKPEGETP